MDRPSSHLGSLDPVGAFCLSDRQCGRCGGRGESGARWRERRRLSRHFEDHLDPDLQACTRILIDSTTHPVGKLDHEDVVRRDRKEVPHVSIAPRFQRVLILDTDWSLELLCRDGQTPSGCAVATTKTPSGADDPHGAIYAANSGNGSLASAPARIESLLQRAWTGKRLPGLRGLPWGRGRRCAVRSLVGRNTGECRVRV